MAIQGLEYIISLNDQLSAPLKGVMKTIDDLGKRGEDAMRRIGLGAAGVIATGVWGSDNICIERNKKIWREKMR